MEAMLRQIAKGTQRSQRMPPLTGIAAMMDRVCELIAIARFMTYVIDSPDFLFQCGVDVRPIAGDVSDRAESTGQLGEQVRSTRETAVIRPTDSPPCFRRPAPT